MLKRKGRYLYGYIRVSSTQQADGCSLESQTKVIKDWAAYNNVKIVCIECDAAMSGTLKIKDRPKVKKIIAQLGPGDIFATYSVSRFSRNLGDALVAVDEIKKRGAYFVTVCPTEMYDTRNPGGENFLKMMLAVSDIQAAQISAASKDSALNFDVMGINHSRPPYGWKKRTNEVGSGLVEVPEQQAVIVYIRHLRSQKDDYGNNKSWNSIAKELDTMGIPTPGGSKTWLISTVKGIHNRHNVNVKGSKK